jgi:hypothetical protein
VRGIYHAWVIVVSLPPLLGDKREGCRSLTRRSFKFQANAKMDLKGMGCKGMDWVQLAQDGVRWCVLETSVMNLLV